MASNEAKIGGDSLIKGTVFGATGTTIRFE